MLSRGLNIDGKSIILLVEMSGSPDGPLWAGLPTRWAGGDFGGKEMWRALTLVFVLFVAGCQATPNPTTGTEAISTAAGIPAGFLEPPISEPSPEIANGVISFTVYEGVCSEVTYGDGRGENNCTNKNVQSTLATSDRIAAGLGEEWRYAFDFWIDPEVPHPGFYGRDALALTGFGINRSRLEIARWQGLRSIKNHIYDIEVDSTRGVTFLGETCVDAESFGAWHRFEMVVDWTSTDTGTISVLCNGREIYRDESVATNQAPHCLVSNHCEPGVFKDPSRFHFAFGIFHDPDFSSGQSSWAPIQEDGLTVRFRDVDVRRLL